jgi:hypothetical protein
MHPHIVCITNHIRFIMCTYRTTLLSPDGIGAAARQHVHETIILWLSYCISHQICVPVHNCHCDPPMAQLSWLGESVPGAIDEQLSLGPSIRPEA